jgi:hypothetical protein
MTEQVPDMNQDIRDFRQPMVTSLGIILGFLLGFLGQWAIKDNGESAIQGRADWVVVLTLMAAISMMLLVLYRLLNNRYPQQRAGHYYQHTFQLYMLSIVVAFSGVVAALFV